MYFSTSIYIYIYNVINCLIKKVFAVVSKKYFWFSGRERRGCEDGTEALRYVEHTVGAARARGPAGRRGQGERPSGAAALPGGGGPLACRRRAEGSVVIINHSLVSQMSNSFNKHWIQKTH